MSFWLLKDDGDFIMRKSTKAASLLLSVAGILLSSCAPHYLNVTGVAYQSIRSKTPVSSRQDIPQDATIILSCQIGPNGEFNVLVQNNTDKIMTIDRTKSFFRNQAGNSIPYYDPTVKVHSQSTTVSGETGASVNLGSIASAAGIGGALGTALSGVNVGGSKGRAITNTNTTYIVDQPQISVAPHGQASMGRTFMVEGVGLSFLSMAVLGATTDVNNVFTPSQTYSACNLCISYSIDDGKTFENIFTDIYANSLLISKVKQTGKINDALRTIFQNKADALGESWYALYFQSDVKENNNKVRVNEILNYK